MTRIIFDPEEPRLAAYERLLVCIRCQDYVIVAEPQGEVIAADTFVCLDCLRQGKGDPEGSPRSFNDPPPPQRIIEERT